MLVAAHHAISKHDGVEVAFDSERINMVELLELYSLPTISSILQRLRWVRRLYSEGPVLTAPCFPCRTRYSLDATSSHRYLVLSNGDE